MKNDQVILYEPEVGIRVEPRCIPYIDYSTCATASADVIKNTVSLLLKVTEPSTEGETMKSVNYYQDALRIEKIIVNGPATIVFFDSSFHWQPNKIIVKRQEGDKPNLEKAILMAMAKRLLGNKYGIINQSLKKYPDDPELAVAYALLHKDLKNYEIRDLVKQGKDVLVDQTKQ